MAVQPPANTADPGRLSADANRILGQEMTREDVTTGFFGITTNVLNDLLNTLINGGEDVKLDQLRRWLRNVHEHFHRRELPAELLAEVSEEQRVQIKKNLGKAEKTRHLFNEAELKVAISCIAERVDDFLEGTAQKKKLAFMYVVEQLQIKADSFRTIEQIGNLRKTIIEPFRNVNKSGVTYMFETNKDVMPDNIINNATNSQKKKIREALWRHYGSAARRIPQMIDQSTEIDDELLAMTIKEEATVKIEEGEPGPSTVKKEIKKEEPEF